MMFVMVEAQWRTRRKCGEMSLFLGEKEGEGYTRGYAICTAISTWTKPEFLR